MISFPYHSENKPRKLESFEKQLRASIIQSDFCKAQSMRPAFARTQRVHKVVRIDLGHDRSQWYLTLVLFKKTSNIQREFLHRFCRQSVEIRLVRAVLGPVIVLVVFSQQNFSRW